MASSSSAPNNANDDGTTVSVKRTAAAVLGPADPAPPVKRRRLAWSPPPSSVKAASSRRPTYPSAGKRAPRAPAAVRGTPRATASWLGRSPTRFAGKSAPRRLVRGIRTPGATSSSVSASPASRSARTTATPAVRSTPRTTTCKHLEATSRRVRDSRISSDPIVDIRLSAEIDKEDAEATAVASHMHQASIYDSVLRNKSKFSEICNSAAVSNPLPTVDCFLGVYEDTIQWKNIAESSSAASAQLSAKYWVAKGGDRSVHELCLPPDASSVGSPKKTAEVAKKLCRLMHRWFLGFVDDALAVDDKWKHSCNCNTQTLVSQFSMISDWLEQVKPQIVEEEEEWTKEMIERLKGRVGDNIRRLKDWGLVRPRTRSRQSHQ